MIKRLEQVLRLFCYYFFLGLWETIGKPLTVLFMLALFLGVIEGTWMQ